jgi:hypothetical protein
LNSLLKVKKKQQKKSKILDVDKHNLDYWGGAQWNSPQQFGEARRREKILKASAHAEELERAKIKNWRQLLSYTTRR